MRWRMLFGVLFLAGCLEGETVQDLLRQHTLEQLNALSRSIGGVMGVAAIDLTSGETLTLNATAEFPQASSIKIAILAEMMAAAKSGKLRFTDRITLAPAEAVGGSGHLAALLSRGPHTLTIEELIAAMMQTSDNTATNRCLRITGLDEVNRHMAALGLDRIRLRRRMMDSEAAAQDRENVAPPLEMARLMEKIYRGQVVDPESSAHMLRIMKLVKADLRKVVPAQIDVASKPGDLTGVRAETGIVFLPRRPFVISVASAFLGAEENPVPRAAAAVFEYFRKLDGSNRYGRALE